MLNLFLLIAFTVILSTMGIYNAHRYLIAQIPLVEWKFYRITLLAFIISASIGFIFWGLFPFYATVWIANFEWSLWTAAAYAFGFYIGAKLLIPPLLIFLKYGWKGPENGI